MPFVNHRALRLRHLRDQGLQAQAGGRRKPDALVMGGKCSIHKMQKRLKGAGVGKQQAVFPGKVGGAV